MKCCTNFSPFLAFYLIVVMVTIVDGFGRIENGSNRLIVYCTSSFLVKPRHSTHHPHPHCFNKPHQQSRVVLRAEEEESLSSPSSSAPGPVLNGKRVLPYKVVMAGIKGQNVAAVFAVLNSDYKGGYTGWEQCEHVGVSMDLETTLELLKTEYGTDKVTHVRAMSFQIPSEGAMESIADDWRNAAAEVGGRINFDPVVAAMEIPSMYDDNEYDDDDDDFLEITSEAMYMARSLSSEEREMTSGDVVSPFDTSTLQKAAVSTATHEKKVFNKDNVDEVLDEIRPYLIADGGNVSVERVDEETRNVYLKLQGACGLCPSSTVTMQMGIERVLKEKFENLGEVLQVEDEASSKPKELTLEAVEAEVNRIKPAIIAMGGMVEIVNVDSSDGVVEMKFQGAARVRQGLELAVRDIDFVKEVNFLPYDL